MNSKTVLKTIPVALGIFSAFVTGLWWFGAGSTTKLSHRAPGSDRPAAGILASNPAQWDGKLISSNGAASNLPGSWPCFRGTNFDAISVDPTPLARTWPESGPKVEWGIDVGEGFAGPVIWKGRIYLLDYSRELRADMIRCLSLADGKELWQYRYSVKVKRNHGMSRTVPFVTDKHLVTMGPKCHVVCLNPETGELKWYLDLVRDFDTEVPEWYAGQCPIIDGDNVILAPAGTALLMAVNAETGKIVWQTPNRMRWKMTHSSIAIVNISGQKYYVYCASGGVAAVSAKDGSLLWQTTEWKISNATVPTPVPLPHNRLFFSGGYEAGSLMMQLNEDITKAPQILFRLKPNIFGATQHTPIFYKDFIYGIKTDGQLVCLDVSGKVIWNSGTSPANRFGNGSFMIAQEMIYALNDSGTLSLIEASPQGYKLLAQAKMLPGPDAWAPMALAGNRLLIRDMFKLMCLNIGSSN